MEEKKPCLSCVDCHVYHCHYQDSKYPEFCLTTNMNPDTYKRAMDALKSEESTSQYPSTTPKASYSAKANRSHTHHYNSHYDKQ